MRTRTVTLLPLLLAGVAGVALAQGLPTSQPSLITIVREEVKVGRAKDHQRIEAGWPAAYEKAKSPDYYLALVSLTGPTEAWYVTPYASHATIGDSMKREDADPVLSAELARLSRADAEVINSVRVMQAMARPDLSYGTFPDLARVRFNEISLYRVRPGHEGSFEKAAQIYRAATQRLARDASYRIYQIVAGAPEPTFLIFSSVQSYGEFDGMLASGQAVMKGMSPEDQAVLQKFALEGLINSETQRFRVDPEQSYVPKETRATDPAFWGPKKPAVKKSTN